MEEILRLRFAEQDKAFTDHLTSIKNKMAARGLLHSGGTVKNGHEALVNELVVSRKAIVTTVAESLAVTKPNRIDNALSDKAIEWLRQRKGFLERYYLEQMKVVVSRLQNKKMLEPYLNLSNVIELNEKELEIELAQAVENYLSSRGTTLFERIKNQFLDKPLVVIFVITIAAVTTVLGFLSLIGVM